MVRDNTQEKLLASLVVGPLRGRVKPPETLKKKLFFIKRKRSRGRGAQTLMVRQKTLIFCVFSLIPYPIVSLYELLVHWAGSLIKILKRLLDFQTDLLISLEVFFQLFQLGLYKLVEVQLCSS